MRVRQEYDPHHLYELKNVRKRQKKCLSSQRWQASGMIKAVFKNAPGINTSPLPVIRDHRLIDHY